MSTLGAICPSSVGGKGEEMTPPQSFTEILRNSGSDKPENEARQEARLHLSRYWVVWDGSAVSGHAVSPSFLALVLGFCIGQSKVSVLWLWLGL